MTRRTEWKTAAVERLQQEVGTVDAHSAEFVERAEFQATVNNYDIKIVVTRYPAGENPEAYVGNEMWTVELIDENGESLDRYHNPESSLELALDMIDWGHVSELVNG